jgi:hypothetical protein
MKIKNKIARKINMKGKKGVVEENKKETQKN